MSTKYTTLRDLSGPLPVPPLLALQEEDLAALWPDMGRVQSHARSILDGIHFTAGAFLDRDLARLDACPALAWHPQADDMLAERLAQAGLSVHEPLAVRSSGSIEDGGAHSFAGVFESVLDVVGPAELRAAITRVWRSAISRRAVIERLRCGLLTAPLGMDVIVQKMVPARWAGVAFSQNPLSGPAGVLVEAVPGLGEGLVSGTLKACSATLTAQGWQGDSTLLAQPAMLDAVGALAQAAEGALGRPADIEWAFDGQQAWLLQARPITTLPTGGVVTDTSPTCLAVPLYLAPDDEVARFKPLPGFVQYFRAKRRPLALLAQAHAVPAGAAWLVKANAAGFADDDAARRVMSGLQGPRVVLDFSDAVRQQVLPLSELPTRLKELLTPQATTFTLRDYIQGDLGLITHPHGGQDGEVLCECSADGLLALNRGSATTERLRIDAEGSATGDGGRQAPPWLTRAQRRQLHHVTLAALKDFGSVQLEWVLDGPQLRLIDFSEVAATMLSHDDGPHRTISPGYARGCALPVGNDGALEDISIAATVSINHLPTADSLGPVMVRLLAQARASSEPVIVASPRPYAALAALIPYVAGFVFEQSSLLCHLAILLREAGVPAVESEVLYRQALRGERLTVQAGQPQAELTENAS